MKKELDRGNEAAGEVGRKKSANPWPGAKDRRLVFSLALYPSA